MKPRFITLEGIDGAGKSTHVAWIAELLRARGDEVVTTREPGGTPLGERLRELLLTQTMHPETEALLMFAARSDHLERVVLPALKRGASVVCDRFSDASYAYQGGGRGVSLAKLEALERWVHEMLQPDLTLLFDCPVAVAAERLTSKRDRFESESGDFFARVREAYLDRARRYAQRIHVIDSCAGIEQVRARIAEILSRT
jgi:dTMP kinase